MGIGASAPISLMKLAELKPGISLVGIEPTVIVNIMAVVPIGDGAFQVIKAHVPTKELYHYSSTLRSLTGGWLGR